MARHADRLDATKLQAVTASGPEMDVGRLLYAVRPKPGPLPIAIMVLVVIVIGGFTYLTNNHSLVLTAFALLIPSLMILAIAAGGFLEQHRVHEHALLVGPTWPRNRPYVIPVSTIDPETVTVHHRANMIARRLKSQGLPTMRMAVYSTRAVSFTGLTYELAHPTANPAELKRYGVVRAVFSGQLMPRQDRSLWALGVRRPQPLLEALEAAFAADGRPAPGLAQRAAAHPIVEPSGRPASR
jgi:hypothetical protein